jgi:hypothetical protein
MRTLSTIARGAFGATGRILMTIVGLIANAILKLLPGDGPTVHDYPILGGAPRRGWNEDR